MRTQTSIAAVTAAVGILALGAAAVAGWLAGAGHDERERSRNDEAVRTYLGSLVRSDYDGAYALVCTDETGTDRASFERGEGGNPIRRFDIGSSTSWSSFVDGHGRVYRVQVTRASGTGFVEIRTQSGERVCIQYGNITDLP